MLRETLRLACLLLVVGVGTGVGAGVASAAAPNGCSHGAPYTYDTSVPLLIHGDRWIKAGRYGDYAETVDIAPTLAQVLNVRVPSASEGKALTRALVTRP